MIIAADRDVVIRNIRRYAELGELNHKVEVGDPELSPAAAEALLDKFYARRRQPLRQALRRQAALGVTRLATRGDAGRIELIGLENLTQDSDFVRSVFAKQGYNYPSFRPLGKKEGAIITSNHFNPMDSIIPMRLAKKLRRRLYIVSQVANLALPAPLNFLTNNLDVLPLPASPNYLAKRFKPELRRLLDKGALVLIYPEEEMWFNYRKPRPCRRGAYQFAAEFNAPIISCFTEIRALDQKENAEFNKLAYRFQIIGLLRPESELSPRANSLRLSELDYRLKVSAYELIYGKKLDYHFEDWDIAGWHCASPD